MSEITLMQGDCLELMKDIPDGSIDMILCDLPYGVTRNEWDVPIPFEPLWQHYERITKENAAIILFSQMPFTVSLAQSNAALFRYEWVYKKRNPVGFLNSHKMPLKAHENILVFYKKLPVYNPQFWFGKPYKKKKQGHGSSNYGKANLITEARSEGKRYPIDVLEFNNATSRGLHPTQKPVALLEYLIRTYTNEGETVLDNCMGSGSTGVACVNTCRSFIGIELDEGYFETAKRRIESARE